MKKSTTFINDMLLNFSTLPTLVHSLTTLTYLAWVGWPWSKDLEPENPKKKTRSCGCTTNSRPHTRVRQD